MRAARGADAGRADRAGADGTAADGTVPWRARISATVAPVVLIGGWTLAAARQPGGFDPVTQTISALAAHGATDRWIMTSALAALGACHVITSSGLPAARPAGRIVLATGGVATLLVATFAQSADGRSAPHAVCATAAFAALTVWPALAMRSDGAGGWALRRRASVAATVALAGGLAWFGTQLGAGTQLGRSERVLAGAQSVWPLVVAVTAALAPPIVTGAGARGGKMPR